MARLEVCKALPALTHDRCKTLWALLQRETPEGVGAHFGTVRSGCRLSLHERLPKLTRQQVRREHDLLNRRIDVDSLRHDTDAFSQKQPRAVTFAPMEQRTQPLDRRVVAT